MDALDILSDLEKAVPYFQPIFSADEHSVSAYEILGRFEMDGEVVSLGPFFQDEDIPEDYKLEVDLAILRKAFQTAVEMDQDVMFFINCEAGLLLHDEEEKLLGLIHEFGPLGLRHKQIVLEITERNGSGQFERLDHLLQYYRTYGIKIAIDKIGNESSNLDRISQLEPDILKVDLGVLRSNSTGPAYRNILFSLSLMARKLGSAVLFKNIETGFQLQFAWKNGGRYYQGYYLKKPAAFPIPPDILKQRLKKDIHGFVISEKKRLQAMYELSEEINILVNDIIAKYKSMKPETHDFLFKTLMSGLDGKAFRMYICNEDGIQRSPNYFKAESGWVVQPEHREKNWSWRPYFLENILKMSKEKKGILSDRYNDIETGATIRTFCTSVESGDYLFIDLDSGYLNEREGLF